MQKRFQLRTQNSKQQDKKNPIDIFLDPNANPQYQKKIEQFKKAVHSDVQDQFDIQSEERGDSILKQLDPQCFAACQLITNYQLLNHQTKCILSCFVTALIEQQKSKIDLQLSQNEQKNIELSFSRELAFRITEPIQKILKTFNYMAEKLFMESCEESGILDALNAQEISLVTADIAEKLEPTCAQNLVGKFGIYKPNSVVMPDAISKSIQTETIVPSQFLTSVKIESNHERIQELKQKLLQRKMQLLEQLSQ